MPKSSMGPEKTPSGNKKLRIGKIAYANLFPIFSVLENNPDNRGYEFIEGVPSELNRRIRNGEIDISPSSSIEYLRHRDAYSIIEDHSISSKGPVRSILLFSRRSIEDLDGRTVLVSTQSETSVALLRIILNKFYEMTCTLEASSEELAEALKTHDSYLLIGDDALREEHKWPDLHVYDAGDIWYKKTGLPFTFALWIVRKGCCFEDPELLEKFTLDLDRAKSTALKNLRRIARISPLRDLLSEDELVAYWEGISYDFAEEHKRGFELFRKYSEELGLL